MMAITHAIASVAVGVLTIQTADTTAIALLILGSQLPDCDNTQSMIGRMVWPAARFIEERWPHRSITHSLWATVTVAAFSFGLCKYLQWDFWLALPIGHFVAICTDTLTPEGVQLFWPAPVWAVCGSNPNARIKTGSKGELFLLAFFAGLLSFSIWTTDTGGTKLWISQLLGARDSVASLMQSKAGEKHIYIEINGTWASDRQVINNQKFWVLEQDGNEFILADKNGIYKTGLNNQIIANRFVPIPGEPAQIKALGLDFNEEEIVGKLQSVLASNPQSLIFLTGTLTIDAPEEMQLTVNPKQLQTLKVTGNQAILESCPINWAINKLNFQFATGSLKLKIVSPPPKQL